MAASLSKFLPLAYLRGEAIAVKITKLSFLWKNFQLVHADLRVVR
jgi:hypothetical protein